MFACPNRRSFANYLSKKQVGRVLAKSLPPPPPPPPLTIIIGAACGHVNGICT